MGFLQVHFAGMKREEKLRKEGEKEKKAEMKVIKTSFSQKKKKWNVMLRRFRDVYFLM